jgi:hypothetical protein
MVKKRNSFAWFDLTRLSQDPTYPSELASRLQYPYPDKLAETLNFCIDILIVPRDGIKDYKNERKRHITQADLSAFPKLSKELKKLCRVNTINWCVRHLGFVVPRSRFFPFEIDLLDMLALHILNYIDEAFSEAESTHGNSDKLENFSKAVYCWDKLQEKRAAWVASLKMTTDFLGLYKETKKINWWMTGQIAAINNKTNAVLTDLLLANILLNKLYAKSNKDKIWLTVSSFVKHWVKELQAICYEEFPVIEQLLARTQESNSQNELITPVRIKRVIQEINRLDETLLIHRITESIPKIDPRKSKMRIFNLELINLEIIWLQEDYIFPFIMRDTKFYHIKPPDKNNSKLIFTDIPETEEDKALKEYIESVRISKKSS